MIEAGMDDTALTTKMTLVDAGPRIVMGEEFGRRFAALFGFDADKIMGMTIKVLPAQPLSIEITFLPNVEDNETIFDAFRRYHLTEVQRGAVAQ